MSDEELEDWRTVDREHALLAGRTGRGVRIAVVDSGVAAGHPHVGEVAGGASIDSGGTVSPDFRDLLGHGTAVAGVLREKAPDAELFAVRVFHRELSTTASGLEAAIELAVERGSRLINLSLGTDNLEHEARLQRSVTRALQRGAIVVSPSAHRGRRWLPGSLRDVVAVELDEALDRHALSFVAQPAKRRALLTCRASGYPRPIPGVPPERNLRGISFAAANVTGLLARLLEDGSIEALERAWAER